MLEVLFGSIAMERVLIFIYARSQGYAREIARFYETDLTPLQNQLKKLELGGILYCREIGRTKQYMLNPRYAFYKELTKLLERALDFLPKNERDKLKITRKRPRRSGKPL